VPNINRKDLLMSRNRLRLLGGAAVAAVAIVASAGAASAHVEVIPDTATQGGEATFALQVPNEEEALNTIKVEVQLPPDQPLGSVALKPHPGWTATVTKAKLATPIKTDDGEVTEAVQTITWTAASTAAAIKPGEFDEFVISAGPLPKADSMQFKTLQTYSDNSVVRWIEPEKPGGAEPEHPAPTLELTPAVAEGASTATPTATAGSVAAAGSSSTKASDSSAASQSSVNLAIGLAVAALIVGLVAGGLALRRRNPAASQSGS
jgi:periplasmic copper chaperone A